MKALMLIVLLLTGCASTTLSDKYAAANACGTPTQCPDEWAVVYRAEDRAASRERKKAACPEGLVKYTNGDDRVNCITPQEVRRMLQRIFQ